MKYLFAAFALAAGMSAAHAQRSSNVNGVVLMKACTAHQTDTCDAYLDGFGDAIRAGGKTGALACIPANTTGTELRDVLVAYLRANPQTQHEKGEMITRLAFQKAYPCRK